VMTLVPPQGVDTATTAWADVTMAGNTTRPPAASPSSFPQQLGEMAFHWGFGQDVGNKLGIQWLAFVSLSRETSGVIVTASCGNICA